MALDKIRLVLAKWLIPDTHHVAKNPPKRKTKELLSGRGAKITSGQPIIQAVDDWKISKEVTDE